MPAVVAAAAGMAAGAAVAGAAVTAGLVVAGGIGAAVISGVAGTVVSSLLGSAMSDTPAAANRGGGSSAAQAASGVLVNTSSTADPIPVIYGSRRVGGIRSFTEVSGSNNQYLHLIITHCEGPVSAINTVYIDGIASTDPKFSGLVTIEKYLGTPGQTASAALIAAVPTKWTASHIGGLLAYTYIRLQYDQNVFRGLPVITADIDGRTLYDVRSGGTGFSKNVSLAVRDYMTNALYGRGIPTGDLDNDAWIESANDCDVTYNDPDAVARAMHTCNGIINTDVNSTENIRNLLTACRGTLLFSARGYGLLIDKAETPTTFEFNEDNIVGSWTINVGSKRTRFNRVRGNWYNHDREWQPDIWPADSSTFRASDNGLLLEAQLALPFTAVIYEAQIKTERHLRQSRFGAMVAFRATIAGMDCEVGDVVPITHSTPGYASKPFRIQRIRLLSSDEVEVEATEYDASVYSDTPLTTPRATPATNLPDPSVVGVPGNPSIEEVQYETTGSSGVKVKAVVTWGAAADIFNAGYMLEYKLTTDSSYTELPKTTALFTELFDMPPGTYNFRIRSENILGYRSSYSSVVVKVLQGLMAPPADVTGFSVRVVSGQALVTLDKTTELDVIIGGRVIVRWSPLTSAAIWNDGTKVSAEDFPGDSSSFYVPLNAGTYMAKFQDSSGNTSVTETSFVVTDAAMTGFTSIASVTEHPLFAGTKSNVSAVLGGIQLDCTTLWDDIPDLDAAGMLDSLGGIQSAGTYTFANAIDLGSVLTVKLFPHIDSVGFDTGDLWDSRTDNIDTWGLIDGSVIEDAECYMEIRTTNDDPAGSPTWGAWHALPGQADYTCRAIQARAQLLTASVSHNRIVTELSLTAKQPT